MSRAGLLEAGEGTEGAFPNRFQGEHSSVDILSLGLSCPEGACEGFLYSYCGYYCSGFSDWDARVLSLRESRRWGQGAV